jgi:hypothetical protein
LGYVTHRSRHDLRAEPRRRDGASHFCCVKNGFVGRFGLETGHFRVPVGGETICGCVRPGRLSGCG